jgi:hypothetical protein
VARRRKSGGLDGHQHAIGRQFEKEIGHGCRWYSIDPERLL